MTVMMKVNKKIPYQVLQDNVEKIFAVYVSPGDAKLIARCLVEADLRGISSHGIMRTAIYARRLREGQINRTPKLAVSGKGGATAHVDGDNGMGYVIATRAMEVAIDLAKKHGVSMVTASHSNHFGMSALYINQAFEAGLGAIVLTNADPTMPVWGGRDPFLGTSPFAMGVPGGKTPLLLDMATSIVALGKIDRARQAGKTIPEGWGLDAERRPTTDPASVINGGVVLPMAGPKGSGLGLLIEAVAGVMSGSLYGGKVRSMYLDFVNPQDVGHFFIAFDPEAFLSHEDYVRRIDDLVDRAKNQKLLEGFDEIVMPGEIESRRKEELRQSGIELLPSDIEMLQNEAKAAGVTIDFP